MLDEFLWKTIIGLQKNKIGQVFVETINDTPIWRFYNDMVYRRDEKKPNSEMLEASELYSRSADRIENIKNSLSDATSKMVFEKVIEYRKTHAKCDRPPYNKKNQYFPSDIVRLREDEVFVDCGAYNGDTIRSFLKFSGGKYDRIIAFEPDAENVKAIKNMGAKVDVIAAAAWNQNTTLCFSDGKGSSSKVDTTGTVSVAAKTIDSVDECRKATFIKMDIEGAEYNALLGAKETIIHNNPLLARCIYHINEDDLRLFE